MKIRSVHYDRQGRISLVEREVGAPGPHEVLMKGINCGICAWDVATCKQGEAMPYPAPPGHEGLAEVVDMGVEVKGVTPGERYAVGGFQTHFLVHKDELAGRRLPASDLAPEHWVVEPVSCCVTALDTSNLRVGDRVALIGCGFMGLIILQMLVHSGASEVHAIDVSARRVELAKQIGGDRVQTHVLDPSATADLGAKLKKHELDIVFDTTGAQGGLDLATQAVRPGGQINLFGWIKGTSARFDPTDWHVHGYTVVNSSPSARVRDPFPPAIRLLASGIVDLRPLVTDVVPMDAYPALMERILKGDDGYVKGVVTLA